MRIAVNTRFLIKDKLEGIGWFTFEVLQRLVKQHPEHEFIFLFDRPYAPEFIFGPNVQPVVLFPPARHATLWYWWFEWSIPLALKRYKADMFLSPDGFLSLNTKVKTLMVTHDIAHVHFPEQIPFHGRVFYKHFVPKYLKRADQVVTVSHFTKSDIIEHYGIPNEKIAVACNGCRETFQPLGESEKSAIRMQYAEGKPYFFYLGAVHPRKNIPRLIHAFDLFKQQTGHEMKLLIAGRLAWQTGEVYDAYEKVSCKEDIVFLGYVPDDQLPKLMGAAFALTYLSLFEGFGVPLLEAMNCKVPIIGADAASIPEVVAKAGILVDPFDVMAISKSMQQIVEEEDLRKRLVSKGVEQAKQFSWDKAAQVVYENLIILAH